MSECVLGISWLSCASQEKSDISAGLNGSIVFPYLHSLFVLRCQLLVFVFSPRSKLFFQSLAFYSVNRLGDGLWLYCVMNVFSKLVMLVEGIQRLSVVLSVALDFAIPVILE